MLKKQPQIKFNSLVCPPLQIYRRVSFAQYTYQSPNKVSCTEDPLSFLADVALGEGAAIPLNDMDLAVDCSKVGYKDESEADSENDSKAILKLTGMSSVTTKPQTKINTTKAKRISPQSIYQPLINNSGLSDHAKRLLSQYIDLVYSKHKNKSGKEPKLLKQQAKMAWDKLMKATGCLVKLSPEYWIDILKLTMRASLTDIVAEIIKPKHFQSAYRHLEQHFMAYKKFFELAKKMNARNAKILVSNLLIEGKRITLDQLFIKLEHGDLADNIRKPFEAVLLIAQQRVQSSEMSQDWLEEKRIIEQSCAELLALELEPMLWVKLISMLVDANFLKIIDEIILHKNFQPVFSYLRSDLSEGEHFLQKLSAGYPACTHYVSEQLYFMPEPTHAQDFFSVLESLQLNKLKKGQIKEFFQLVSPKRKTAIVNYKKTEQLLDKWKEIASEEFIELAETNMPFYLRILDKVVNRQLFVIAQEMIGQPFFWQNFADLKYLRSRKERYDSIVRTLNKQNCTSNLIQFLEKNLCQNSDFQQEKRLCDTKRKACADDLDLPLEQLFKRVQGIHQDKLKKIKPN